MTKIFVVLLILSNSITVFSQKEKTINYFGYTADRNNGRDSSLFAQATIKDGTILFTTPGHKDTSGDSVLAAAFNVAPSIYGPYKFKKFKNQILFIKLGKWKKFRLLYSLDTSHFSAPELFTNDFDFLYETTYLGISILLINNKLVPCYKFLQDHSGLDGWYETIYVETHSLIPLKYESFKNKEMLSSHGYTQAFDW